MPGAEVRLTTVDGQTPALRTILPRFKEMLMQRLTALSLQMPGAEVRLTAALRAAGQTRAIRTILPPIKEMSTPRLTALKHSALVYELSFGAEIRLTIADGEK